MRNKNVSTQRYFSEILRQYKNFVQNISLIQKQLRNGSLIFQRSSLSQQQVQRQQVNYNFWNSWFVNSTLQAMITKAISTSVSGQKQLVYHEQQQQQQQQQQQKEVQGLILDDNGINLTPQNSYLMQQSFQNKNIQNAFAAVLGNLNGGQERHLLWDYAHHCLTHDKMISEMSKLGNCRAVNKIPFLPIDLLSPPKLYALDTEMCVVIQKNNKHRRVAVLVTLVDEFGNKLMEEIIKPVLPIVDYKFDFTGLTENDFKDVKYSIQNAARDIKAVIGSNGRSILVGHSIVNDFRGLSFYHLPVIDTAILFCKDRSENCTLDSLRSLGKQWLDVEVSAGQHDPGEDAKLSLDLVKYVCSKGIKPWLQRCEFDAL
eukprot:TRINITY_DN5502_c1_g1_i3.p1 TRINITY_DN5502_c1_g1~~TRINITY_DN5502_c1_g1_i3.p1  ORF type:complete len:372 (+),score=27.42 TRINITY_DN5502_c1_g1_i3:94-1209(+)